MTWKARKAEGPKTRLCGAPATEERMAEASTKYRRMKPGGKLDRLLGILILLALPAIVVGCIIAAAFQARGR